MEINSERMHDHGEVLGWGTVATAIGYGLTHKIAALFVVPPWFGQVTLTLFVWAVTLIGGHFVKRELNRRWPDRFKRRSGDTSE